MSDEEQGRAPGKRITSSVEVEVSPAVAFAAFTGELNLWWVRGPINHWAAGRMIEIRLEPHVGGRLLEVYGQGEPLELGRVTLWEPGRRVAWKSCVDDVDTDVS